MGILKIASSVALVWLMFVEGMGIELRDLLGMRRRLLLLLRAFLAVDVLVPLAAWGLVLWIAPDRPIAGALVLLAACPIAPLSFYRIVKAGGAPEVVAGIHIVLALLSVVTTPWTLSLLGGALGFDVEISPLRVARQVAFALLLPLLAGIALRALFPSLAKTLQRPGARAALLLLAAEFVIVLVTFARSILEMGLREYAAMVAFVVAALAIGHAMGGRDLRDRTVFALESASRNLGLAFFIASFIPHERPALPILVPYVVVFALITALYLRLVRQRNAAST